MKTAKDLTGQRFGRLMVIRRVEDYVSPAGYHSQVWECKCDCGKMVNTIKNNLLRGASASCGCLRHEIQINNGRWKGHSMELLHYVWLAMRGRCNNPNNKGYKDYGGRGIIVCKEWNEDYFAFKTWAESHGYEQGLTLDRIDVNGNYEPSNCRWVTRKVQSINKQNTDYIEYCGETLPLTVWAERLGIKYKTLRARLYTYGKTVEEAFATAGRLRGNDGK